MTDCSEPEADLLKCGLDLQDDAHRIVAKRTPVRFGPNVSSYAVRAPQIRRRVRSNENLSTTQSQCWIRSMERSRAS